MGGCGMTKEEAKKMGATHYLLVPKGSGDPYYLFEKDGKYYFFQSKDEFTFKHMIDYIKPI